MRPCRITLFVRLRTGWRLIIRLWVAWVRWLYWDGSLRTLLRVLRICFLVIRLFRLRGLISRVVRGGVNGRIPCLFVVCRVLRFSCVWLNESRCRGRLLWVIWIFGLRLGARGRMRRFIRRGRILLLPLCVLVITMVCRVRWGMTCVILLLCRRRIVTRLIVVTRFVILCVG